MQNEINIDIEFIIRDTRARPVTLQQSQLPNKCADKGISGPSKSTRGKLSLTVVSCHAPNIDEDAI